MAAQSEPVKGALVPAGKGMKMASMLGQANLTSRQRRLWIFRLWLSGRAYQHGTNPNLWKAPGNRISPAKVGLIQVGIGAIDPGTTVEGNNAERTYRP